MVWGQNDRKERVWTVVGGRERIRKELKRWGEGKSDVQKGKVYHRKEKWFIQHLRRMNSASGF